MIALSRQTLIRILADPRAAALKGIASKPAPRRTPALPVICAVDARRKVLKCSGVIVENGTCVDPVALVKT